MDELRYQQLLDTPNAFLTSPGKRKLDCLYFCDRKTQDQTQDNIFQTSSIREDELPAWLDHLDTLPKPRSLRLIIIPSDRKTTSYSLRLTRSSFERLINVFNISHQFLNMVWGEAFTILGPDLTLLNLDPPAHGITIRIPTAGNPLTMGITLDPTSGSICCLLYGTIFPNKDMYFEYLQVLREKVLCLVALPIAQIEVQLRQRLSNESTINYALMEIDTAIGFSYSEEMGYFYREGKDEYWDKVDFKDVKDVNLKMRFLSTNIDTMKFDVRTWVDLLHALETMQSVLVSSKNRSPINEAATSDDTVHQWLHDRFVHLQRLHESLTRSLDQQSAARDTLNQLINNLISQRDNIMARKLAEQSATIAEQSIAIARASRLDTLAMKSLAEDSRRIAKSTLRDAAAMKVIAAVTILFLPATFTATYFSTSFFNFRADAGQSVVSSNHWIYWVTTVILTVAIHASWYLVYKSRERRIERTFSEPPTDQGIELMLQEPVMKSVVTHRSRPASAQSLRAAATPLTTSTNSLQTAPVSPRLSTAQSSMRTGAQSSRPISIRSNGVQHV